MQLGVQALYVEDWCNLDTSNHEGNKQEQRTWKHWPVGAPGYLRYIGNEQLPALLYTDCHKPIQAHVKSTNGESEVWGFEGVPLINTPFHNKIPGKQTTNPNQQFSISWNEGKEQKKHMLLFNVRRNITWM